MQPLKENQRDYTKEESLKLLAKSIELTSYRSKETALNTAIKAQLMDVLEEIIDKQLE